MESQTILLFVGPRGCGKSSLARALFMRLPHRLERAVPRWLDPAEERVEYTREVKMALEGRPNPPPTYVLLDYTHLYSQERHAPFYQFDNRRVVHVLFVHPGGSRDLAQLCEDRLMRANHCHPPRLPGGLVQCGKQTSKRPSNKDSNAERQSGKSEGKGQGKGGERQRGRHHGREDDTRAVQGEECPSHPAEKFEGDEEREAYEKTVQELLQKSKSSSTTEVLQVNVETPFGVAVEQVLSYLESTRRTSSSGPEFQSQGIDVTGQNGSDVPAVYVCIPRAVEELPSDWESIALDYDEYRHQLGWSRSVLYASATISDIAPIVRALSYAPESCEGKIQQNEFHVTLKFFKSQRCPFYLQRLFAWKKCTFGLKELIWDDHGAAITVSTMPDLPCANKIAHITVANAPGVFPVYSNKLCDLEEPLPNRHVVPLTDKEFVYGNVVFR